MDQLKALKDPKVIKYCQYYSIVFGGYVAMSLWMVQYYVGEFGLDIRVAALLAACFSLPGGVLRALGGVLSDKYGAHSVTWWVLWVSWICLFLLSYPQTDFTIQTVNGPTTFHLGLNVYLFTALMFILGIAWAFGKASVFKYISDDYPTNIGTISGIVGPGRRHGRLRLAHHVRRHDGPHRHPLQRLHADVRRGLGLADLDVLDRGARHIGHGRSRPSGRSRLKPRTGYQTRISIMTTQTYSRADITDWRPEDDKFWNNGQDRWPTATCGSRFPTCSSALPCGACGGSSRCRC
jgi:hypothetical protein